MASPSPVPSDALRAAPQDGPLPALLDRTLREQRGRAVAMGAQVRLTGAALLLLLVTALWRLGGEDWQPYVLPLALYLLCALALFLVRAKRGVTARATLQSLLDVALVYWVQHEALPVSPFPAVSYTHLTLPTN